MITYASSLDCVGIMSNSIDKVAAIFDVLNQYDLKDPTAIPSQYRQKAIADNLDIKRPRIGIPLELLPAEIQPSVLEALRKTIRLLKDRGASIETVSISSIPYALSAYYIISSSEAASNLARYDGVRYGALFTLVAVVL